jgi:hypothetical protein
MIHRMPEPDFHCLHFKPNYVVRFVLAWILIVVGIYWMLDKNLVYSVVDFLGIPKYVSLRIAYAFMPWYFLGAAYSLKGKYLQFDRQTGEIQTAWGFSGILAPWRKAGSFTVDGQILFEYCELDLRQLCVMSYRSTDQDAWLPLYVYNGWDDAHQAAEIIRKWEPRLQVEEFQEQTMAAKLKDLKALVS